MKDFCWNNRGNRRHFSLFVASKSKHFLHFLHVLISSLPTERRVGRNRLLIILRGKRKNTSIMHFFLVSLSSSLQKKNVSCKSFSGGMPFLLWSRNKRASSSTKRLLKDDQLDCASDLLDRRKMKETSGRCWWQKRKRKRDRKRDSYQDLHMTYKCNRCVLIMLYSRSCLFDREGFWTKVDSCLLFLSLESVMRQKLKSEVCCFESDSYPTQSYEQSVKRPECPSYPCIER